MKTTIRIFLTAILMMISFITVSNAQIRTVEEPNIEKIYIGNCNDSFRILETINETDTLISLYIPCKNDISNDGAMFILGHSKTDAINEMLKLKELFNATKIDGTIKLIDTQDRVIKIIRIATCNLTEKMKSNPRMLNKWTVFCFYCDILPGYVKRGTYSNYLTNYFSEVNGNVEQLFDYYLTQMDIKLK